MGLIYREVLDEMVYAYIVDRPGIYYAIVDLSKFSNNPSESHYASIRRVLGNLV